MKVLFPFTRSYPEAIEAIVQTPDRPIGLYVRPILGTHLSRYWEILAEMWQEGSTFAVVEHDVVVRPTTLIELEDCPEPWCAYPVSYLGGVNYGLGCCRFSADVLRAAPDALTQVAKVSTPDHPSKHWCALDGRLQAVLTARKLVLHRHEGDPLAHVGHDGEHSSHGCV